MRAIQLTAHGSPGTFQSADLPKPQPAPDEVLIQVKACGLNRVELWAEQGSLPVRMQLPRPLGGEIAGVVTALGTEVASWRTGDRVAIQSNLSCGTCEFCLKGEESIC